MRQEQFILDRPRERRRPRFLRYLLPFVLLAAGSVYPHMAARRLPGGEDVHADAVFVLTGGENRISEGLRAWKKRPGAHLHIIGAGRETAISQVIPGYRSIAEGDRERIHMEGWSENTLENAFSAKGVVADEGYRRILLVTSDYHLPRAYLALRSSVPATVDIRVLPVRSAWRGKDATLRKARMFFREAWKYWGFRIFLRWE